LFMARCRCLSVASSRRVWRVIRRRTFVARGGGAHAGHHVARGHGGASFPAREERILCTRRRRCGCERDDDVAARSLALAICRLVDACIWSLAAAFRSQSCVRTYVRTRLHRFFFFFSYFVTTISVLYSACFDSRLLFLFLLPRARGSFGGELLGCAAEVLTGHKEHGRG
jgi:hypothetical protein